MIKVSVFQSEFNEFILMDYVGLVKYVGDSFGVDSLTNDKEYFIVLDKNNDYKVVDDSGEDYLYDLVNPKPVDGSSEGGKFYFIDDPLGILEKYIGKYERSLG